MKRILSVLLVCALVFALTACGNSEIKEASDKLQSVIDNAIDNLDEEVADDDVANDEQDANDGSSDFEDAINDYADSISGVVTGYDDINKYIEASINTESFKSTVESLKNSGLALTLEADGNNLVYKYTYTVPVVDNVAELLKDQLANSDSTYEAIASAIRVEAPCVEKVVWEYYTSDGEFITSIEK